MLGHRQYVGYSCILYYLCLFIVWNRRGGFPTVKQCVLLAGSNRRMTELGPTLPALTKFAWHVSLPVDSYTMWVVLLNVHTAKLLLASCGTKESVVTFSLCGANGAQLSSGHLSVTGLTRQTNDVISQTEHFTESQKKNKNICQRIILQSSDVWIVILASILFNSTHKPTAYVLCFSKNKKIAAKKTNIFLHLSYKKNKHTEHLFTD